MAVLVSISIAVAIIKHSDYHRRLVYQEGTLQDGYLKDNRAKALLNSRIQTIEEEVVSQRKAATGNRREALGSEEITRLTLLSDRSSLISL